MRRLIRKFKGGRDAKKIWDPAELVLGSQIKGDSVSLENTLWKRINMGKKALIDLEE